MSMPPAVRENLFGFREHFQELVDKQLAGEFPDLGPVAVVLGEYPPEREYYWADYRRDVITLNTGSIIGRDFFLNADDRILQDIIRHELLHAELWKNGEPFRDRDFWFTLQATRRDIVVNYNMVVMFEKYFGRGSFELFRKNKGAATHLYHIIRNVFGERLSFWYWRVETRVELFIIRFCKLFGIKY